MNNQSHRHARSTSKIPKSFASIADENRRLATDCLRVLRLEMQLETIFHLQVCFVITEVSYLFFFFLYISTIKMEKMRTKVFMQEMTNREYLEDQDAEEPDDFIISLTTQVCFLLFVVYLKW